MSPKVSVIIPCYGVEAYLDKCVESVLAQTLQDFEIILVDDESPDRVPEMCDAWAARDGRIRVVHKKNAGLGMACNSGLALATGRYVAFLDSDDWVDLEMYETLYWAAEEHGAQMVFSGLRRVDDEGRELGELPHKEQMMLCAGREEVEALACDMVASAPHILCERSLQMSAKVVLYCRDTIEKHLVRFVSEREVISEDLHFNLEMLAHSSCVCVLPQFFYNYRCTEGSITQKVNHAQFARIKRLYDYVQRECLNLNLGIQIQQRVQRLLMGYTRQYIRQLVRSAVPFRHKYRIIRSIVQDPIWGPIWAEYPVAEMPLKLRLYLRFFRMKWVSMLMIMLDLV